MSEDEDICGAETQSGEPCQNPSRESCPWHKQNGNRTDKSPGRKSKFEDVKEDILQAARKGITQKGCARAAGITQTTLYDWLNKKPKFSKEFARARSEGEQKLVEQVRTQDPKFLLERSFDYIKRQEIRQEVVDERDPVDRLRSLYEEETGLKVEREEEEEESEEVVDK